MTGSAHADQLALTTIPDTKGQVWPILQMFHVVDDLCLCIPTFGLAPLTLVVVQVQNLIPHYPPRL